MDRQRDHGGSLDAAVAKFGGHRKDWIDLSTGINPLPYPVGPISQPAWTALPDATAQTTLTNAAREYWNVPNDMSVLAAPGASALIARLPGLWPVGRVDVPTPTYNEHAAAFSAHNWIEDAEAPLVRVLVHPNNPTGHWYHPADLSAPFTIIDESFADVSPERSLIAQAANGNCIVLKSFGKFWGLAGMRLGFAIGPSDLIARLAEMLGPWPVSGPALEIGAVALQDFDWTNQTRKRLNTDAARLDALMMGAGAAVEGGTSLFRLYGVDDAKEWQVRLAKHRIWTRIFPYSKTFIRLGLPAPADWPRLEDAL